MKSNNTTVVRVDKTFLVAIDEITAYMEKEMGVNMSRADVTRVIGKQIPKMDVNILIPLERVNRHGRKRFKLMEDNPVFSL